MSSAALTTNHLPHLRALLSKWESKQSTPKGFATPLPKTSISAAAEGHPDGKDVLVAFRTRPPLEHEAEDKFGPAAPLNDNATKSTNEGDDVNLTAQDGQSAEDGPAKVEFCMGISVTSAEPGEFVAHVPGMKVRTQLLVGVFLILTQNDTC
jgi:kinesin family protein 2/24